MSPEQNERLRAAQIIAALGNEEGRHPSFSKVRCEAYFAAQGWEMPDDFAAYVTNGAQNDSDFLTPCTIWAANAATHLKA
jgi:hypothetical protein